VTAIRPPSVPENTARLRVAFSAAHTMEQVTQFGARIKQILQTAGEVGEFAEPVTQGK